MSNGWNDTRLWKEIQGRGDNAQAARAMLSLALTKIVLILGDTADANFTLHDKEHSYRVAERMVELMPDQLLSNLSNYELALLLLSAYLHDIGMSPKRKKTKLHYDFLLNGPPGEDIKTEERLSAEEQDEFQIWLDNTGTGIVPPLEKTDPPSKANDHADELIAYYTRERHNDWSEEWIKENKTLFHLQNYSSFPDDLVQICRSHHEGYDELADSRFDAKFVGQSLVHLRYLAALLRLADVLENDPDRTPQILLDHRAVALASIPYWTKDHYFNVQPVENGFVFTAQTPNAEMQFAVSETAALIEKELQLCNKLATFKHFTTIPGSNNGHYYKWKWSGGLITKIEPAPTANYEYIHGAFRPNTQKLLELLSGIELYGNRMVAVREILQNAFDAVREQIAYQRLKLTQQDKILVDAITALREVTLTLEAQDGVGWLVCKDNGVGMTKGIIDKYLLVSGATNRHDLLDLERKCKEKGFTLGRTGQFGIGVLSYFMLANKLELRTRRSQEAGSPESHGWRFETEGVGSFGELTRDFAQGAGTELRLRLKSEVTGNDFGRWYEGLKQFLKDTLTYLPCPFLLQTTLKDHEELRMPAGWQDRLHLLLSEVCADISPRASYRKETPTEYLPLSEREKREAEAEDWRKAREEAEKLLRFEVFTGELPDGLGEYRIYLPYFDLPGGKSLAFLRVSEEAGQLKIKRVGDGFYYQWKGDTRTSWKGIRVQGTREQAKEDVDFMLDTLQKVKGNWPVAVEINWTAKEAGHVTVNRNMFMLNSKAALCLEWLQIKVKEIITNFVGKMHGNPYANLAKCATGLNEALQEPCDWLATNNWFKGDYWWKPISFPATSSSLTRYTKGFDGRQKYFSQLYLHNGREIAVVPSLGDVHHDEHYEGLLWHPNNLPPDKMLVGNMPKGIQILPVWSREPSHAHHQADIMGWTCSFPQNYGHLCGVVFSNYHNDNQNSPPCAGRTLSHENLVFLPYSISSGGHKGRFRIGAKRPKKQSDQ